MILDCLPDLEDNQMEYSVSASLQRTCPPQLISNAISTFDDLMFEALSNLVGRPLSSTTWMKASLPTALNGTGTVLLPMQHAAACYIASVIASPSPCMVFNLLVSFHTHL